MNRCGAHHADGARICDACMDFSIGIHRMNLHGLLDQLLKSQSGGSLLGSTDFQKGAAGGGALGLLLGRNRKTRKLATYGGLAAIGVMAYQAWREHQQQTGGAMAEPQTVDRLPPPQAGVHSEAILRALIAAAKADGHIDARERQVIEGEFQRLGQGAEVERWLSAELAKPLDPSEVARAAGSPEVASEMYIASLLVTDEQNFMERSYLDELARQLRLDAALKSRLENQVAQHAT